MQLSIVSNLLLSLGHSSHFLDEVYGFIRLYQNQILRALCIMSEYSLSLGSLEECSRVAELFYGLARVSSAQGSPSDVLTGYQDFALRLLSNVIYLFKSPMELKRTSLPISNAERSLMVPLGDSNDVLKMSNKTKFIQTMERLLIRLSFTLLSHFRLVTQADLILKSQIPATDLSRCIFQITMQSQSIQGCSIGSLFDGVRYFTGYLNKQLEENFDALQMPSANVLGFAAETGLTLIASQLALSLCMDDLEPSIFREIQAEVSQSVQDYSNLLAKASTKESIGKMVPGWTAPTLKQAKERVTLLESFSQRLMF
jgi:hypothetical protein